MNVLRGNIAHLHRCTAISTASDGEGATPRCKPLKYAYEKEIVLYAYFKKLDYFSTECIYSPNASRGHAHAFLKDLESIRPSSIIDVIHSGETLSKKEGVKMPVVGPLWGTWASPRWSDLWPCNCVQQPLPPCGVTRVSPLWGGGFCPPRHGVTAGPPGQSPERPARGWARPGGST